MRFQRARAQTRVWFVTILALAFVGLTDSAGATTLVSLNPELNPSGPTPATFTFGLEPAPPMAFETGPGATSNGANNLPPAQHPPGLELKTPLSITDPASTYNRQNNVDGSTTFYDTTLVLTGLIADGPAQHFSPVPGLQFDFQVLTAGTFSIYSSPGGPPSTGPLLLRGTITTAVISGIDGASIGSTASSTIQYTSGEIYDALIAHGGTTSGSVTFNLSLIANVPFQSSVFAINSSEPNFLLPFSALGQGIFDTPVVPEPTSELLAMMGLTALFGLVQFKRHRRHRAPVS